MNENVIEIKAKIEDWVNEMEGYHHNYSQVEIANTAYKALGIFKEILGHYNKYFPEPTANMDEPVDVLVYGTRKHYRARRKAIEVFEGYVRMSEGPQRDRYINILNKLKDGLKICTDGC